MHECPGVQTTECPGVQTTECPGVQTTARRIKHIPNSSLTAVAVSLAVAKDLRPQWRRMTWNSEGSLLAVAMR